MAKRRCLARACDWLRALLIGRGFARAIERHTDAADRLDAALRELLKT